MRNRPRKINTAMVPIGTGDSGKAALAMAQVIAQEVVLVGVVAVAPDEALSKAGKIARQVRKRLFALSSPTVRYRSVVIVSASPWEDLSGLIAKESPDLLIVEWQNGTTSCGIPVSEILSTSLCDVAVVRSADPIKFDQTLIAIRGGVQGELAFRVGMWLNAGKLDVLNLTLTGAEKDASFKGLMRVIKQIPEVTLHSMVVDDIVKTIYEKAQNYDTVVLGASTSPKMGVSIIGPVAEKMLREATCTVIVVKTRRPESSAWYDESVGAHAISILVDKWFAENTYHADEFSDLSHLVELKESRGMSISLALPALNEEKTIGKVIKTVKEALMEQVPLLDEIVLLDSNSTDRTREIAAEFEVPTYIHQQLLPELGARTGKGEALWKSLLVTKGDIICWIDTDIVNIHPRFVYGIIGPLLLNPNVQFVKGFYRRPIRVGGKMKVGGGGRVTELAARPLLNLFYPELSGVIQPLSGEYAGRRTALESAIFFSGYGVETGLLIDIFERYGLRSIAQVDLLERVHHNQELEALSKMSFAIIQTVLRKIETRYERAILDDVNKTMKLVHYANGSYFLDVEEIAELDRPPMINVPAYREKHKK